MDVITGGNTWRHSEDDDEAWHHQNRKRVEVIREFNDSEDYRAYNTARPRPVRRPSEARTPDPTTVSNGDPLVAKAAACGI